MADIRKKKAAEHSSEMDELFRMLDKMEKRTLGDDVEEAILQYGYGDNPPPPNQQPVPDLEQNDLSQLLINPVEPDEQEALEAIQQAAMLVDTVVEDEVEDMPPPPEERRNPLKVLVDFFAVNLPKKEDTPRMLAHKGGFWAVLVALVCVMVYLVIGLVIQPRLNARLNRKLNSLYYPERTSIVYDTKYPQGMLSAFKDLYRRNDDVSGWLSFHAGGTTDFLNMEYPVMYSGDDTYLRTDFDGKKNKNGTLYLDKNNAVTGYDQQDQAMFVYGQNVASGQMLSGLNKLIGNVSNARMASTFTFSTLYRKDEYRVFAVVLSDESEEGKNTYFDYYHTDFANGEQFLAYIRQVRDRSLFDYPTDVREDDKILILSTSTGRTNAHLKEGRVLVFARRCRQVESQFTANNITRNNDVIMPYNWYVSQNLRPHTYYGNGESVNTTTTTTTTITTTTTTTTTTTVVDTSDVSDVSDVSDTSAPTSTEVDTSATETSTDVTDTSDESDISDESDASDESDVSADAETSDETESSDVSDDATSSDEEQESSATEDASATNSNEQG